MSVTHLVKTSLSEMSDEMLRANPGFSEFVAKGRLDGYVSSVDVDAQSREILLLFQGVLTPWKRIAPYIHYEGERWTGSYLKTGIETRDLFNWKTLSASETGDPAEWDHQYIFEFVVWHQAVPSSENLPPLADRAPQPMGVHTYFHLKTPEDRDNIFSVGFYRPHKRDGVTGLICPLRMRPGDFESPDESDMWLGEFSKLSVSITKAQFQAMKTRVEADKKAGRIYHLTHRNCNEYTIEIAKLAGINMPTSFIPITQFMPAACPLPVLNRMVSIFMNIVGVSCCGGCRVEPEARRMGARPHITSFSDLCDPNKSSFSHPNALEKAFQEIENWRSKDLEKRRFALPEKFQALF